MQPWVTLVEAGIAILVVGIFVVATAGVFVVMMKFFARIVAMIGRCFDAVFRDVGEPRPLHDGRPYVEGGWIAPVDGPGKPCRDPQCRMVNVPAARFCARCGRRLA